MPSGFCCGSMNGTEMSLLSRTIAKWLATGCGSTPGSRFAVPRWAISRVVFCHFLRPVLGEVERDVRRAGAAGRVGVLLGVLDVRAAQGRVVLEDEVGVAGRGDRLGVVGVRLGLDDDVALGDLDVGRRPLARVGARVARGGLLGVLRAAEDRLGLVVDAVPECRSCVFVGSSLRLAACDACLTASYWVCERAGAGRAGRRAAGDVRVGRGGLAVRAEDVLLPVVERQLGGRADLLLRLVGVLDVRERDVDLVRRPSAGSPARRRRGCRRARA